MKENASPRSSQRVGLAATDPLRLLGLQTIVAGSYRLKAVPLSRLDARCVENLDAVLLDASGAERLFELLATFHRLNPQIRLIVIGTDTSHEFIRKVIGAGAKGYLTQTAAAAEVRKAIAAVLKGSLWAPRGALTLLLQTDSARPLVPPRLTKREAQVLRLLADGQPNREIAAALKVAEKTVKAHVGRLMRKMGVDNRTALAIQAVRWNMVSNGGSADG